MTMQLVNQGSSALKIRYPSETKEVIKGNRRPASVLQRAESERIFLFGPDQTTADEGSSRKIKVLLPKISSKKDLRLEIINPNPLPILPFPRVVGKDIVSPFKRQGSATTRIFTTSLPDDCMPSD